MVASLHQTYPLKYQRRRPEMSLLYRTVESYWPTFVQEQKKVGKVLPLFIQDEFTKFLECGIPEYGFIRTYCYHCRHSGVVPFSCKKRGFCPSCCAKRMNNEAAHLVDVVLPEIPYRQWVLSFPYKLRFLMARNQELTNAALKIFHHTIGSFQKKKAKKNGLGKVQTGAVTFIQRFGSALNLNIHFHTLFPDGVFLESDDGYVFCRQSSPSLEELTQLAAKIQKKVLRCVEKIGLNEDFQESFDEEGLGELASMSVANKSGFGERAGKGIRRFGAKNIEVDPEGRDPYSANVGGFSLNARVWIAGSDRKKLERLIRYMARGPLAMERLTESFPNQLLYKMKSPWRDGTTHVSFSPLDFIARLVALIPPPRMNMIRYSGCFAPNFKDRKSIIKNKSAQKKCAEICNSDLPEKVKHERLRWAEMLKRVFEIDVTICPKCSGRMEQIAVIKDKAVAKKIIESLGEVTTFRPLEVVADRGPPESWAFQDDFDQRDSTW